MGLLDNEIHVRFIFHREKILSILKKAIKLNGFELGGMRLKVEYAKSQKKTAEQMEGQNRNRTT
eukprot:scaffold52252_cov35-Cyclotella_meneghiniana.AAC.5